MRAVGLTEVGGPEVLGEVGLPNPRPGYQHPSQLPDEVVDAYGHPVLGTPQPARASARLIAALSSDDLATVRSQLGDFECPQSSRGAPVNCSSRSNGPGDLVS